jgi:hypothetical protein
MSLSFDGAAICKDSVKGRCMVATRDFSAGDKLWVESAYIFASADEEDEDVIAMDLEMWSTIIKCTSTKSSNKKKKKNISLEKAIQLTDALVALRSVASLDTARCLLKLIIIALQSPGRTLDDSALLFLQLEPANLGRCVEDITIFRTDHPSVLPDQLSTDFVARLVGVLNNNQMELDLSGADGSGLFVASAILEHNCHPNCSFSTSGSSLYMMAMEPIICGDRLSIDYGNNYCRPTFYRRIYLYKTYSFFCDCVMCEGPDHSRCFLCPACKSGTVYAINSSETAEARAATISAVESGQDPDNIYIPGFDALSACDQCNEVPSMEYVSLTAQTEEDLVTSGLAHAQLQSTRSCTELWNNIENIRNGEGHILQEVHYLMFWAVDKIAEFTSHASSNGMSDVSDALLKAIEVTRLMNIFLPALHHEKVLMYDKMGQLAVAKGDIPAASDYFGKACSMSTLVCGADNPSTLKLRLLATDTPDSIQALMSHYHTMHDDSMLECDDGGAEEEGYWEDDDEEEDA